jgi:cell division protein FtsQ
MQQVWRKRWRNTGWIALGAITLVLLVSAIQKKNHKDCAGVEVTFNREGNNFFVDEKGVIGLLKAYGPIKGESIENINLKALEQRLKSDRWIANAELFFDNKQVLQVIVEEKEPVARIFTVEGSSFYIDSACRRLPLSEKLSARIPMFTSFPSGRLVLSRPDSQLLGAAKELALFIQADEFWRAQVAQVDITPNGFEMIPTVGSHVVVLGKDGNWQQKFDRLFSFYRQVWTQVGFEKYEKIDVQFDGQIVATVKGAKPAKVDSVKARMAYENLLAEVKKSDVDSIAAFAVNAIVKDTAKVNTAAVSKQSQQINNAIRKKLLPANKNILKTPSKAVTAKPKQATVVPVKPATVKQVAKPAVVKPAVTKQVGTNRKVEDKKVSKAVMKPAGQVKVEKKKGK